MSNYKIRVNSKAESKEAQGYFEDLGAVCCSGLERSKNVNFLFMNSGFVTACKLQENFDKSKCKEITLPELRDLVILNRNDPKDATHYRNDGKEYFQTCDKERHYHFQDDAWVLSTWMNYQLLPQLKPIEKKEMKEYLDKQQDGTYKLIKADGGCIDRDWIEIPEGAIKAYLNNSKTINFVNSDDDYMNTATNGEWIDTHRGKHEACGHELIWQRAKHPEELPFIDDECYTNKSDGGFRLPISEPCDISKWVELRGESINDQYAEIEKVRQSAWKKQEGGSHYKNLKIQPMQYALENKLDYAQANVVKYVTRHADKNGKEDLLKAIHNIELMIEFYYGDEK